MAIKGAIPMAHDDVFPTGASWWARSTEAGLRPVDP